MTEDSEQSHSHPNPVNSNKRQDNSRWLEMWRNDQTDDFHQTAVNPLLKQFWHHQKPDKNCRVLVPLCGKSLDMLWLAEQGHSVIGVELSPVAAKAFFKENNLKVKKSRHGNFTCWRSGNIVIWCGDFFSLQTQQLGHIDIVFDRASLTALHENVREQYVAQLRAIIDSEASVFLLTVEDIAKATRQHKSHIDDEIVSLYGRYFEIELTHVQRLDSSPGRSTDQGFFTDSKVYHLSKSSLPPQA